jgi:hypothetical protein
VLFNGKILRLEQFGDSESGVPLPEFVEWANRKFSSDQTAMQCARFRFRRKGRSTHWGTHRRCRELRSADPVCESPANMWLTASLGVLFLLAVLTIFSIACHVRVPTSVTASNLDLACLFVASPSGLTDTGRNVGLGEGFSACTHIPLSMVRCVLST